MKAYSNIHYGALWIFNFAYFILKKSIELWENIHDLKSIETWFCQSSSRSRFNGLGFNVATTTPIRAVKIIMNPKPMKHRLYESQSPNLFIFLHIDLHTWGNDIRLTLRWRILCCLQNYCITHELRTRHASSNSKNKICPWFPNLKPFDYIT